MVQRQKSHGAESGGGRRQKLAVEFCRTAEASGGRWQEAEQRWRNLIGKFCHATEAGGAGGHRMTIILIGNKCDLSHRRVVSYQEGEQFAKEHGLLFMEASAKTAHNVEKAFFLAARTVHKKIEDGVINLLDESTEEEKHYSCWF
uniref:Uncharacterized protein n=1 Tax=Oryza nivara TaxID=4536 RepID=A0A0E0G3Y0_ORYNI